MGEYKNGNIRAGDIKMETLRTVEQNGKHRTGNILMSNIGKGNIMNGKHRDGGYDDGKHRDVGYKDKKTSSSGM